MKLLHAMQHFALIFKSIAGILFLLCAIGVAIFLPYKSLHYPFAWIYLGLFGGSVLAITLYLILFDNYLLKSRLQVGPAAERSKTQKLIQSVAGLLFLAIFVISALDYKNGWRPLPVGISYAADAACILAFVWLFFVFKQNTFLSATVEVREEQKVISTGLYGIVRHPMYTGAMALLLATPPALGSLCGLLPALLIIIVIGLRAMDEEKELAKQLPGYTDYCQQVKFRLLPFIF